MKKLTKLFAGLAAAAALFGAVGCTTQDDYVNENKGTSTAVRNAFIVKGLYVKGLDTAYNGNKWTFGFSSVNDDGDLETEELSGTVAEYNAERKVGYDSGIIYYALPADSDYSIYDGDALAQLYSKKHQNDSDFAATAFAASSLEFYLKVGNDYVFGTDDEGEPLTKKIAVPTSPADTSDADLVARWISVEIENGVPEISLVKTVDEKDALAPSLTNIGIDISSYTKSTDAVSISTDSSSDGKHKYTLVVKGLESDQVDLEVQLAGSKIAPIDGTTSYELGDYWYGGETDVISAAKQEESPLHQTIAKATEDKESLGIKKDDVYVAWEFYGDTPSWADGKEGPAIKVYKFGEENKDKVYFLQANKDNFFFPSYTYGNDVTVIIDVSNLKKGTDYVKAAATPASEIRLAGICVANLDVTDSETWYLNSTDGAFGSDTDKASLAFIKETEVNGDLWKYLNSGESKINTGTQKFVPFSSKKQLIWTPSEAVKVTAGQSSFILGFRAIKAKNADEFNWDTQKAFNTANLLTADYTNEDNKEYILYGDAVTGVAYLLPKDKIDSDYFVNAVAKANGSKWWHCQLDLKTGAETIAENKYEDAKKKWAAATSHAENEKEPKETDFAWDNKTLNLIINADGHGQTKTFNPTWDSDGTVVYYIWRSNSGNPGEATDNILSVEKPTATKTSGKIDIYVYTDDSAPNAYLCGGINETDWSINFTGDWGGIPLEKDSE